MPFEEKVKLMSHLKAQAAYIVREFAFNPELIIATQTCDKKMVAMDIGTCEMREETLAFLQLLSLGKIDLTEGKLQSARDFFAEMDAEE